MAISNYFRVWIVASLCLFADAIPIDNGLAGEPEVQCGSSSILISVNTRNNFEGRVYVKGHAKERECAMGAVGDNHKAALLEVPFASCGVQRQRSLNPRGVFVTTTIIVSFHPLFETKVDRAIRFQCFYMEVDKTVAQELDVSPLTTGDFVSQQAPMPICRYDILDGPNGTAVRFASVGQAVTHRWFCDTETVNTFCMLVYSCFVSDGLQESVELLDNLGCAQDRFLLGNLEYVSDLTATKEASVFKFADITHAFFVCQIRITVKEPGQQCLRPQCPDPSRGKRLAPLGGPRSVRQRTHATKQVSLSNRTTPSLAAEEEYDDDVSREPSSTLDVAAPEMVIADLDLSEPTATDEERAHRSKPSPSAGLSNSWSLLTSLLNRATDGSKSSPPAGGSKPGQSADFCLSPLAFILIASGGLLLVLLVLTISIFCCVKRHYRNSAKVPMSYYYGPNY